MYACIFLFLSIYHPKGHLLAELLFAWGGGQSVLFRPSTNWMRPPTLSTLLKVQFKCQSHPKQYFQTHTE